jgi:hypothetical protein
VIIFHSKTDATASRATCWLLDQPIQTHQQEKHMTMEYKVKPIREAGIECKWSRNSANAPIILGRGTDGRWYYIDRAMWKRAQSVGIAQAFEEHTTLGKWFSIPA